MTTYHHGNVKEKVFYREAGAKALPALARLPQFFAYVPRSHTAIG